jgi:hypothetical protein
MLGAHHMISISTLDVSVLHTPVTFMPFDWQHVLFGECCRHHAKPGVRGTLNRDTLLRDSNLTLPPHLRYLLHL